MFAFSTPSLLPLIFWTLEGERGSSLELRSFRQRVVSPTVSSPTSRIDSPTSRIDSPTSRIDSPTSRVDSPTSRVVSKSFRKSFQRWLMLHACMFSRKLATTTMTKKTMNLIVWLHWVIHRYMFQVEKSLPREKILTENCCYTISD
jgi:hypothetical protein